MDRGYGLTNLKFIFGHILLGSAPIEIVKLKAG